MKIDITTQEYRDLLDILHIADVVMTGHRREEDPRSKRHRTLIQKLYALTQGEGLNGLISHNENVKMYIPTAEFETTSLAHVVIDAFGDHLFWDKLIERLSTRDAAQMTGGMDKLNALSDADRQSLERSIRQRYVQEFSMNGVAKLELVERFGIDGGTPTDTSD